MIRKISALFLTLVVALSLVGVSQTASTTELVAKDDQGESAADMYSKRLRILFTVIDCSGDQLLWDTSEDAANVWMSLTPIQIILQLDTENCVAGAFGNSISEIYWGVEFLTEAPLTGTYSRSYNAGTRDIVEEDLVPNQFLVINQARDLQTTTPIVLYNALVHLMGNAIGLASIHELYPEDCGWSVMLSACMRARNPPQNADLAAIDEIYFKRPEMSFQVYVFDENGNGLIDRSELNTAIDLWVFGGLQDEFFMELVSFWVSQDPIPLAHEVSPHPRQAAIRIYNTHGILIDQQECTGYLHYQTAKRLHRMPIPTGVYIALIRDCQSGQISVKMISKLP